MLDIKGFKERKAQEIEELDMNLPESKRKVWDLVIEKHMKKYDADNSLSIGECVKTMPVSDIMKMNDDLIEILY